LQKLEKEIASRTTSKLLSKSNDRAQDLAARVRQAQKATKAAAGTSLKAASSKEAALSSALSKLQMEVKVRKQ
jgi:glucosamine 6-phosphate synthetase-like amidotransferase/phosphosugar isomerase protein